jgi:hypothetical protein
MVVLSIQIVWAAMYLVAYSDADVGACPYFAFSEDQGAS